MATKRPTFEGFRKKALSDAKVRAEYDALGPAYEIKRQMIAMRKQAGLTQEEMAERLGTKKSNISRLESLNAENSPRLSTLEAYAKALGHSLDVQFKPLEQAPR